MPYFRVNDFTKMAAKNDPVTRLVSPRKVSEHPRPREGGVTS